MPVPELLRKYAVSKTTFFKRRSYGGATLSGVKRLRELEVERMA